MTVEAALKVIQTITGDTRPRFGFILGSGLGDLADRVEGKAIDYADIPGFPDAGVSGHSARLVIGKLHDVEVAILSGREHYYENGRADAMRLPLEVLSALGVETLFATNACGSFLPEIPPGNLMLIKDHINYSGKSPLIGEPTDRRFVNLTDAYDPDLRASLAASAADQNIPLIEGVYAWYSGPNFETPAEIRACSSFWAPMRSACRPCPRSSSRRFLGMRCCGGVGRHQHGRRFGQ